MRYIGCKRRHLPAIESVINSHNIETGTFCDLFSGTGTVGSHFKQLGFTVYSNDLLRSSYIQQVVNIQLNRMPNFKRLAEYLGICSLNKSSYVMDVISYLNALEGIKGYIYSTYAPKENNKDLNSRKYFTSKNAKRIDAIREKIASWTEYNLISHEEHCVLVYSLLDEVSKRANTTATQTSYLKKFQLGALKDLELKVPDVSPSYLRHKSHQNDALSFIKTLSMVDLLYLDPPYTKQQYSTAYHLLETVARWDKPQVSGVAGVPSQGESMQSPFSKRREVESALEKILKSGKYRHLIMSYNNEGLLSHDEVTTLLARYGELTVYEHPSRRYKCMSSHDPRSKGYSTVTEYLYYLKPRQAMTTEIGVATPIWYPQRRTKEVNMSTN